MSVPPQKRPSEDIEEVKRVRVTQIPQDSSDLPIKSEIKKVDVAGENIQVNRVDEQDKDAQVSVGSGEGQRCSIFCRWCVNVKQPFVRPIVRAYDRPDDNNICGDPDCVIRCPLPKGTPVDSDSDDEVVTCRFCARETDHETESCPYVEKIRGLRRDDGSYDISTRCYVCGGDHEDDPDFDQCPDPRFDNQDDLGF